MRVLIIGASGFIGSYITGAFLNDNHDVVACVRDVEKTKGRFPLVQVISCDFNQDVTPESWLGRLENIDVVVNVAGLLNSSGSNKIENVHVKGPEALFDACTKAKIKRIIHISALGIDEEKTTDYSITKKAADSYLQDITTIDWVILKPSLVYAGGCYGGTSLLRGLASIPYFIFLIGNGLQQFQPIHMSDLTNVILYCAKTDGEIKKTFKIVGPEVVTVRDILISFRKWMGLPPAIIVEIPLIFIKLVVLLADKIGRGPLNATSYKMMMQPNIADKRDFIEYTSIVPKSLSEGLSCDPLTIGSLWHARLFLLKPLLKWMLGLFWIVSGVIGLISSKNGMQIIRNLGFGESFALTIFYSTCLLDIILGACLIIKQKITTTCLVQILVMIGYTLALTFFQAELWLDPLGCLTKNIPIIFLTLVVLAIEKDK